MAGDWIKVEHATANKPEVLAMAEALGVSRREMLGILTDYFIWLDVNARHANVTQMSRKSLDLVLNCEGLAACLERVGWVSWDDSGRVMAITKYDRHNGTSAKNRALAAERKRRQRVTQESRNKRDNSVTREEKRSCNKKIDAPTEEHRALATTLGLNCADQYERYRDWQASTGKSHKDEVAGFRNWLKNAKGIGPAKPIRGVIVGDWWRSEQGVERRARELGLWPARPGESHEQFIARLQKAAPRDVA